MSRNSVKVDWRGADLSGGGGFLIADGLYEMELVEAEATTSKTGNPQIVWDFKGLDGEAKGKKFRYWTSLQKQALFKLKALLEAFGHDIDGTAIGELDLDELIGGIVLGDVRQDTYDGKVRSKLSDVLPSGQAERTQDEPVAKNGKGPSKMSAEEVNGLDEDEMESLVTKYNLDVDLSKLKTPRRRANAIISALEEEGLLV
jgi:hypothetical protein